jgi:hypothetical protein
MLISGRAQRVVVVVVGNNTSGESFRGWDLDSALSEPPLRLPPSKTLRVHLASAAQA